MMAMRPHETRSPATFRDDAEVGVEGGLRVLLHTHLEALFAPDASMDGSIAILKIYVRFLDVYGHL